MLVIALPLLSKGKLACWAVCERRPIRLDNVQEKGKLEVIVALSVKVPCLHKVTELVQLKYKT